jgi:hypothetical protein
MSDYTFDGRTFVIKNYLKKQTFANFLPGLAGKKGIPLWTFYVNRGQGVSGFGLANKNHPIMAFTPANKAYETVGQIGFRTFMKVNGSYYEPFRLKNNVPHEMRIDRERFSIIEKHPSHGLNLKVTYFGLPNENLGGLARIVELTNTSDQPIELEMLDGLAEVLPAGVQNSAFKEMSNLLSSWMDVDDLDKQMAFYKLRSSTNDSSQVTALKDGNFMISSSDHTFITPIVDRDLVFGADSSLNDPICFQNTSLTDLIKQPQITANKIPCGFIPVVKQLAPNETIRINTLFGHVASNELIYRFKETINNDAYFKQKESEARQLIDTLIEDVQTETNFPIFDEYVKQNYLDNFLRGGYPEAIGNTIYHLYSRRHGDLERDYNFFDIAPEYYSNGAGNFRDVCQNRRMDSFIHPEVKQFNVKHFASLIQLDGYNPLTVQGMIYSIKSDSLKGELVSRHFEDSDGLVVAFLDQPFTPGGLVNFIELHSIVVKTSDESYLNDIIGNADEHIKGAFGEGYWVDHFTYILDLVEHFEAIYPDLMDDLLFKDKTVKTFDSPVSVRDKSEKTVLTNDSQVRQFGSLMHFDEEKIETLKMDPHSANFAKFGNRDYHTNVFTKLFILVLTKHAGLDPDGIGVEMEGGKPGWNDAMNGLPGLFGSGVSETIELKRIVTFLQKYVGEESISLPVELVELFKSLSNDPLYQERVAAREHYRQAIRFGLKGETQLIGPSQLSEYLEALDHTLTTQLEMVFEENDHIMPTFVVYEANNHRLIKEEDDIVTGVTGDPLVAVGGFTRRYLPNFLEAPARLLKTNFDQTLLKEMTQQIKASAIYDAPLKMYKTSEPLDNEGVEIGRIRAFTPGWLERESNFLHMTYKYLLGLLKAGLYDTFYEEIKDNLVCFMDPSVYKRSTLENSSFIAPSNNPNPAIHGQGFFARLSGSTVEVVNMWAIMMTGGHPFRLLDNDLILKFEPKLPASFFKEDKTVQFKFLKDIDVTIVNADLVDTYNEGRVTKIVLESDEESVEIDSDYIYSKYAKRVRDGYYKKINILIKK